MKKSDKFYLILWGVLSALTLIVIYGQSTLSKAESSNVSGFVTTFLKPILDPANLWSDSDFHHFVRKMGHFTEYACFGFFFGNFSRLLGKIKSTSYISMPLLVALGVAVSDEYLQYFTGRGSMVTDVVLDFSGALFGFFVIFVIDFLLKRRKTHEVGLS